MFLSRRVATMEVEFVSIERVMEYTRLPREAPPGAPEAPEERPQGAAVLAEGLYLRYEVRKGKRHGNGTKQLDVSISFFKCMFLMDIGCI